MPVSRREFLGGAASLLAAPAGRRPNIILILTDDQGYGDLSLHGNPYLRTPNLDRLARQGIQFTRFYVCPVCAPTRASLLTGRYHLRCGVHGVTWGRETMRTQETTIAEALRAAGYSTALIGKWHLGEHYPYVPHAQGFQEFIGFRTGHWNNYFDSLLERNGKPYPTSGYISDALTDEAIRFVERNRRAPFFLYLAYNAPHAPFQVPEQYFERYRAMNLPPETAAVYGMVSNIDDNVGRLLKRLDDLGLAQDTIVIFLTDNGPNGQRYNAGLRGRKGSVYEGGVRVPFFLRWPRGIPRPGRVEQIAAHIDVFPTLLELCGVPPPRGLPLDGVSLVPLLLGQASQWPDRMLFFHAERRPDPSAIFPGAVRTQRFNLINGEELYDLSNDPGEQRNVIAEHPELARRLRSAYEKWFAEVSRECGFRRPRIPVGYREENPVTLPAPQAWLHGRLRFYEGNGWAHDWISQWTDERDWVHWELEVVNAGRYRVSLRYLCPESDLGGRVRIEAGGSSVEALITRATPMQPVPTREVVPRTEAPVMQWATLEMGELVLPKGPVDLAVRALRKPGRTLMELKEVVLYRS